jgi:RimJ/RimL family protein N-acetyltransferase
MASRLRPGAQGAAVEIHSDRLTLRSWRESDRAAFAALNSAPEVMQDLGGPLDRAASDAKFDRYVTAFQNHGFCRWALEDCDGQFLGYVGVSPSRPHHPLGASGARPGAKATLPKPPKPHCGMFSSG